MSVRVALTGFTTGDGRRFIYLLPVLFFFISDGGERFLKVLYGEFFSLLVTERLARLLQLPRLSNFYRLL